MGFPSLNIIALNASLIFGLLIFITFQILADPSSELEEKGIKLLESRDELILEAETNKYIIKENCGEHSKLNSLEITINDVSEVNSYCLELAFKDALLTKKMEVQKNRYDQYVAVQNKMNTLPVSILIAGLNVFHDLLIVPFLVSIIAEIIHASKSPKDSESSKIGIVSCIVGFVLLGIVIIMAAVLIAYQEYLWKAFY